MKAHHAGYELFKETFDWDGGATVSSRQSKHIQSGHEVAPHEDFRRLSKTSVKDTLTSFASDSKDSFLKALWHRQEFRRKQFQLTSTPGEHSCFDGFYSMIHNTNRCNGWQRVYPSKGSNLTFTNTGMGYESVFTLVETVGKHINVWLEEGSTSQHQSVAIKAAQIYANVENVEELKPTSETESWMDQECKVFGAMPFMFTCSDRINILVQQCGIENAWVMPRDFLVNYPKPENNESSPNSDIVFYMCHELIDETPNPYSAATTFAHELAHVIQGGFGESFIPITEGGAAWLEGDLLHLPPRPIAFGWGFNDWNKILAAHLYASTRPQNARKFYQIHAYLLTYLSQKELLGESATSNMQNYKTFESETEPWGRGIFDYFVSALGKGEPSTFSPVSLNSSDLFHPFGTVLLDYRVAIASQCIAEASRRPTETRYLMPEHLRDYPSWDCSTFPVSWSASESGKAEGSKDIYYGGAAIFRLAKPQGATITISKDADPEIRTKVLAAGDSAGNQAEVRELRPGDSVTFLGGARELFIVQVNVDPAGEIEAGEAGKGLWQRSEFGCEETEGCSGYAWSTARNHDDYPANALASLRSPLVKLPETTDVFLSFKAKWDLEQRPTEHQSISGCTVDGYDGVQVRVHVYHNETSNVQEDGDEVHVLQPSTGYIEGNTSNEGAVTSFIERKLLKPLGSHISCSDARAYTGSSPGGKFILQNFSLAKQAGSSIRIEIIFASDAGEGARGFWFDDLAIVAKGVELFKDDSEPDEAPGKSLFEHLFPVAPEAGTVGGVDGIPVVLQYPGGFGPDMEVDTVSVTKQAPWTASWATAPTDSDSSLRRDYLGWSYVTESERVATANLHPWQEACMQFESPFRGSLETVTLFTLVDKVGVGSVDLVARSAVKPYNLIEGCNSSLNSPGVSDQGVHRFNLASQWTKTFDHGENFLLCVGTGHVKSLAYDEQGLQPFLHLPLSQANSNTQAEGQPGWTFLRSSSGDAMITDPWRGFTVSIRSEFVESKRRRLAEERLESLIV
jgi:hypothetical protein